jgi:hypothetical protein
MLQENSAQCPSSYIGPGFLVTQSADATPGSGDLAVVHYST